MRYSAYLPGEGCGRESPSYQRRPPKVKGPGNGPNLSGKRIVAGGRPGESGSLSR